MDEELQKRIQELIPGLGSEKPGDAINELSKIGKPAIPALFEALQDRNRDVQKKPTQAIAKIEDLLKSKDTLLRKSVVSTLVQIGIPAVPELIGALKHKSTGVKTCAAEALGKIGFDNIGFNEKIMCLLILRKKDEIIKIGKPAIPALIGALHDEYMRWRVIQAFEGIGDNSTVPALIEALDDEDRLVRVEAAKAVVKIFNNIKTAEDLREFEIKLQQGYDQLRKKLRKKNKTEVQIMIAKLKMAIAKKKNQLAEDKGVLLELPKLPKKGMYRIQDTRLGTLRRSLNG